MDELVMKVMIFAQFHESLWSHAHSFFIIITWNSFCRKWIWFFNQRMIPEWFEAIQAHRCQTFQVLVSEPRVSISHMYCVYMRPCARFSGGKRQFPDGQHHKKPPRLTTARLWLHFPKETALLPTISFDSFFLAWQRYPILMIFMFPLWASIQKNHGHLKDYPISELSCFIRNKLSQEEAHIPKSPQIVQRSICSAVSDSDSTFSDLIVSRILARTETRRYRCWRTKGSVQWVPGVAFF